MYKTFDFECQDCSAVFEARIKSDKQFPDACPGCEGTTFKKLPSAPAIMNSIVPVYPGSKRLKAGYQHTHNRPAEKAATQVSMYSGTKKD